VKTFFAILTVLFLLGCGSAPLRPGKSGFNQKNGISAQVQQSENPQQATSQTYRRTEELSTNGAVAKVTEELETKIGSAQKDVAREITAKLGSLRPVMYVGILLFLFGAGSFVYPPLKLLVGGSVTTSAVIALAGLAMIVLPSLIVGNELVIMGVAVGAAVLYWFSHRHGKLQGFVDANRDGIDDRNQV